MSGEIRFRRSGDETPGEPLKSTVGAIVARALCAPVEAEWPQDLGQRLEDYLQRLLDTNRHVNLVSRRNTEMHVERFVRECLFLAALLRRDRERIGAEPLRLLDLGSGGGFPGIVLKLALPDVHVQLVEATRKKASFLAQVGEALDMRGMSVLWARSEELARAQGTGAASYRWVTSKGLGTILESTRLAAPFLLEGGVHWTFKGPSCKEELAAAGGFFRQRGFAPFALEPIPGGDESYVVGVARLGRGSGGRPRRGR